MPRDALKTRASKPGMIGVFNSMLSALARAMSSCGSDMSAGVLLFSTSAAAYPSIRSAPTLKIWMTPFASVAMLEKLALLKIALWRAPVVSSAFARPASLRLLLVPIFRRATVGVCRRSTGGVLGGVITDLAFFRSPRLSHRGWKRLQHRRSCAARYQVAAARVAR